MPDAFTAPDGTSYTLAELQARVCEVEPAIFHFRELPTSTAELYRAMYGHMVECAPTSHRRWACIMDLTEVTSRPQGGYKEAINSTARSEGSHNALVQPGSILLRTVLRFLTANSGNTSVHATYAEALSACRTYVNEAASS